MRKRFLTFFLVILLSAFPIFIFASADVGGAVTEQQSVPVSVQYVGGGQDTVYCIDVEWTDMSFTYYAGDGLIWDSNTHKYLQVNQGWSNDGKATITVTNQSNCPIDVQITYVSSKKTIEIVGDIIGGNFSLPSAEGKLIGDKTLTSTATLSLSGDVPTVTETMTEINVGTVTVTVSAHEE